MLPDLQGTHLRLLTVYMFATGYEDLEEDRPTFLHPQRETESCSKEWVPDKSIHTPNKS